MVTYRILLGLAASLAFTSVANAEVLAAGPVYGGGSQTNATCYVMNVGIQTVKISDVTIRTQGGGAVVGGTNSCGTFLTKGASCNVFVPITNNQAYSCTVSIRNNFSSENLRGTLDIRANTAILVVTPLR